MGKVEGVATRREKPRRRRTTLDILWQRKVSDKIKGKKKGLGLFVVSSVLQMKKGKEKSRHLSGGQSAGSEQEVSKGGQKLRRIKL